MSNSTTDFHYQTDFTADELSQRRARVMDAIGTGAVALLQGSPASGAFDRFRQHNDFYYLCGVEVPHVYLLIDGRSRQSNLYLSPDDEKQRSSEGAVMSCDDAAKVCELTGVDQVRPQECLEKDLAGVEKIFTLNRDPEGRQACQDTLRHARQQIEADRWDRLPPAGTRFREKLDVVLPQSLHADLSPILDSKRLIKSSAELAVMRRAGQLTGAAVSEAMRCTRPGMLEFQLAALADLIYLAGGARGGGYRPIVAAGKNICSPHYFRNDCPLVDGDLVLMDYAPDLGNYTSDIGRMWPVGGRYCDWQRELYGFIVEYHKILLRLIRPGVTAKQIYQQAANEAEPLVSATSWSDPLFEQAARNVLVFNGHLTHPVGMAVHDVGEYHDQPLRVGTVIALDPQLWVPAKELYIRVEDTVVVTPDGVENLTASAPLELQHVEHLMTQPGVYDRCPWILESPDDQDRFGR